MTCYEHGQTGVETPAIGTCVDCGVGVCAEHSKLVEGTKNVRTGNLMQMRSAQSRSLVCLFDAASRAGSQAARAV